MMTLPTSQRTMVFCTSHSNDLKGWEDRYARWFRGIELTIDADAVIMIDDGSRVLPSWPGIPVYRGLPDLGPSAKFIYHFEDNLGRPDVLDYPGWFRSFTFAAQLADILNCDRIIHIESDAFILSRRFADYVQSSTGWTCPVSTMGRTPESGVQIIAPDARHLFQEFAQSHYDKFRGFLIEHMIPYTAKTHDFVGDRYGESSLVVPWEADWTMQTPMQAYAPKQPYHPGYGWSLHDINYFWFLSVERTGDLAYNPELQARWMKHGSEFSTNASGVGRIVRDCQKPFWVGVLPLGLVVGPSVDADSCARRLMTQAMLGSKPTNKIRVAPQPQAGDVDLVKVGNRGGKVWSVQVNGIDIWSYVDQHTQGELDNVGDASTYVSLTNRLLLDELASRYMAEYPPYLRGNMTSVKWAIEVDGERTWDSVTCKIVFKRVPRDVVCIDTILWIVRDVDGVWDARSRWVERGNRVVAPDLSAVLDMLLTKNHLRSIRSQPRHTGHFGMPLDDEADQSYPINMYVD